ncbi:alpha/beta hydrolase [Mycobacterium sp. OAE908]
MTKRLDVEFTSEGTTCRAWLYLPTSRQRAPVIVMAHGFGGIREMRLDAFAERFCDAGYACLVFDYRHFGASDGQPRQLLDINRQLADWSAAIAFARTRPDVDTSRIILWGSSFSGGHVITTASREPDITAAIAQCPFSDGIASVLAMDRWTGLKVFARGVADALAGVVGKGPILLPIVGTPGSTAVMTAPDAQPAMLRMVPPGASWRNEVAARVALQVVRYRPGRNAKNVPCPLLLCVCSGDSVAPAAITSREGRKAPQGEIQLYPEGHFDIYDGEPFERVIVDEIDFLHRHVPVGAESSS